METVRYQSKPGPGSSGTYIIHLSTRDNGEPHVIELNLSLEALMQLEERIKAARQHMITH